MPEPFEFGDVWSELILSAGIHDYVYDGEDGLW